MSPSSRCWSRRAAGIVENSLWPVCVQSRVRSSSHCTSLPERQTRTTHGFYSMRRHGKQKPDFNRGLSDASLARLGSGYFVQTMIWEPPQNSRQHRSVPAAKSGLGCVHQRRTKCCHIDTLTKERRPGSREDKTLALFRGFPDDMFTSVRTLHLSQTHTL